MAKQQRYIEFKAHDAKTWPDKEGWYKVRFAGSKHAYPLYWNDGQRWMGQDREGDWVISAAPVDYRPFNEDEEI